MELSVVPSPNELTQTLKKRCVFTMASSPPEHTDIKFFLFAQHVSQYVPIYVFVTVVTIGTLQVSTLHYFLAEGNLQKSTGVLKVTLKCEHSGQAEAFMKHFRECLVGKWIAQNPLEIS